MKKINIIINSMTAGGAEKVVATLLNKLNEDYIITLILLNDTIFFKIPDNIKIINLENSKLKTNGFFKFIKLPVLAYKYVNIYEKADVSISFLVRPNYINVLAKIFGLKSKVIITELSMPSLQHEQGIQGLINRHLISLLYGKSDSIIANSYGNSRDLIKNFCINKVKTIYSPVDIKMIIEESYQNVNFRDECFTFITVGRLDEGKNHILIIKAMTRLNAKLFIIGDGELYDQLYNTIMELKLENKVFLLGNQSNPYKYLRQADCFVFTSLREGLPTVLLEALACGLPIISSDCRSGPREILAPKSNFDFEQVDSIEFADFGILIPVDRNDILLEAMLYVMENNDIRINYSNKAITRAYDFDIQYIAKQYIDLF